MDAPAQSGLATSILEGAVVDKHSGAPLSAFLFNGSGELLCKAQAGDFQIALNQWPVTITARLEGYLPSQVRIEGTESEPIRIEMIGARTTTLHVVDAEGEPVRGANVYVLRQARDTGSLALAEWRRHLGVTNGSGAFRGALPGGAAIYVSHERRTSSIVRVTKAEQRIQLSEYPTATFGVRTEPMSDKDPIALSLSYDSSVGVASVAILATPHEQLNLAWPRGTMTVASPGFEFKFHVASEQSSYSLRTATSQGSGYASKVELRPTDADIWLSGVRSPGPYVVAANAAGGGLAKFAVWQEFRVPSSGAWVTVQRDGGLKSGDGAPICIEVLAHVADDPTSSRLMVGAMGYDAREIDLAVFQELEDVHVVPLYLRSGPSVPLYVQDERGEAYRRPIIVRELDTNRVLHEGVPTFPDGSVGPFSVRAQRMRVAVLAPSDGVVDPPIEAELVAEQVDQVVVVIARSGAIRATGTTLADVSGLRAVSSKGRVFGGVWDGSAVLFPGLPPGEYTIMGQNEVSAAVGQLSRDALFSTADSQLTFALVVDSAQTVEVQLSDREASVTRAGFVDFGVEVTEPVYVISVPPGQPVPSRIHNLDALTVIADDGRFELVDGRDDDRRLVAVRVVEGWYVPLGDVVLDKRTTLSLSRCVVHAQGLSEYCCQLTIDDVGAPRLCIGCTSDGATLDLGWVPSGTHRLRIQGPEGRELSSLESLGPSSSRIEIDGRPATREAAWQRAATPLVHQGLSPR
jgi:hypothetical protein